MVQQPIKKILRLGKEIEILNDLKEGLKIFEEDSNISERDLFQMRLVLDELVTNTVKYGFETQEGSGIDIEIELRPGEYYEIVYSDDAPMFDPVKYCSPDNKCGNEEAGFGGFGISLIKKMMDIISYRYENGKNIIYLKKHLVN